MLYLVPTITLFQERTPQRLFGRVVSTRQALTFGAMALSQAAAGYLAGVIGSAEVLMLGGGVIFFAGLLGLALPLHAQRPLRLGPWQDYRQAVA